MRRGFAVFAVVFAMLGAVTVRLFVWPDIPATPPRADAIVILGGPGDRERAGILLARDHRATVVVESWWKPGAVSNRCLDPIPDVTIVCFHAEPNTTQGEAEFVGRLAEQRHWRSVILVVTPDQAWRARLWFARCFSGDIYVSTTPLPGLMWPRQVPYQWLASVKALAFERRC
jgi:uncharacterized SAM-binding protein YcdF (DUF218 family)